MEPISTASPLSSSSPSTPTTSSSMGSPYRRRSSGSSPARRRPKLPLTGRKWFLHQLSRCQGIVTLFVWISNLITFLSGYGKFKALRWVDAPFVLWLQRPKSMAHQFVTHGLGKQIWAPMLAVEMLYAWAYTRQHLVLTRALLVPLALYYWGVFNRIASAEQRLRNSKGKVISWEEYLCIYLPFAIKSGFLSASACVNLTAMLTIDYPHTHPYLVGAVAYFSQLGLVILGMHAILIHDCHITLAWSIWGLKGQPAPTSILPYVFRSLPTFLLFVVRAYKSLTGYIKNWAAAAAATAAGTAATATKVSHTAGGRAAVFLADVEGLEHVSGYVDGMARRAGQRLEGVETQVEEAFHAAVTWCHYLQISIYTSFWDYCSSPASPSLSSLKQSKPTFAAAPAAVATAPPPAKEEMANAAVVTGSGALSTILEGEEEKETSNTNTSSPASSASSSEKSRSSHPSSSFPFYLFVVPFSFLLGASFFALLLLTPPRSLLPHGEVLQVGERLRYRCSMHHYFSSFPSSSSPSTSCQDLDLVLGKNGVLSLFRDRRVGEEAALVWQSEGRGEGAYLAKVDERSRLVVMSVEGEVVWASPRLVEVGEEGKEGGKEGGGAMVVDGTLGGMYVTDAKGEPTFVTSW